MCRNDKVLMQYKLALDLYDTVSDSKFEVKSVGRLGVTLQKSEKSRWDNLLKIGEGSRQKPGNMIVWWEMLDKYEEDLDKWTKDKLKEAEQLKKESTEETPVVEE